MPIENDQFDEQAPDFTKPEVLGMPQPALGPQPRTSEERHGVGKGVVLLAVLIVVGILAIIYYVVFMKPVPNGTSQPLSCPPGQPNCPSPASQLK